MVLTVRRQLVGSALLALAGFVAFGVVAYVTVSELKINDATTGSSRGRTWSRTWSRRRSSWWRPISPCTR